MSATQSSDFAFSPVVWQDHIRAYFDRLLVYGAFAAKDDSLQPDAGKGTTVSFPFFTKAGDAQEPAESEGLLVDNIEDDSFTCTVKEVGKAIGIKKKAFKKSAARSAVIVDEVQRQIARVHAEKVDKDLVAEFAANGNFRNGYTATDNLHTMNIRTLNTARNVAFGDKANKALVCFMHSLQYNDLMNDTTGGFLKADALDPMAWVEGFMGRVLGMAIVVVDTVPATASQIDSTNAYRAFIHKANPYGICTKQEMEVESDYDILAREWVFTGNEWYGVKSFHAKAAADDYRTAEVITTVSA